VEVVSHAVDEERISIRIGHRGKGIWAKAGALLEAPGLVNPQILCVINCRRLKKESICIVTHAVVKDDGLCGLLEGHSEYPYRNYASGRRARVSTHPNRIWAYRAAIDVLASILFDDDCTNGSTS
jgi:hypothetical protein